MALHCRIETELETDGRWIAEAVGLPGVLAYGQNENDAIKHVEALALRVIADRIEREVPARGRSLGSRPAEWLRCFVSVVNQENRMERTHEMDFVCNAQGFHPGLNITVREGEEWKKAQPGDYLRIRQTGSGDLMHVARVVHSVGTDFESLPEYWLAFEHSPEARTKEGLALVLDEIYGDDSLWRQTITVVFFWL